MKKKRGPSESRSAAAHRDAGIAKFSPPTRAIAKAALARLRALLPGATEFIYDNYNALVVGFGPNDRPSDAVFSVVIYPRQVNLGFIHGAVLDDPDKVLQGSGTQFRHIKLIPDASVLDRPEVRAVMMVPRFSIKVRGTRRGCCSADSAGCWLASVSAGCRAAMPRCTACAAG